MGVFTKYEFQQMKVNRSHGEDCIGKLRKVCNGDSNWDIYWNGSYCMSIAKENSGASDSVYGKIDHVRKMIREGYISEKHLTKLGRRLVNGKS